jgi:5-methylcytosine-specific restriction protein A
MFKVKAMQSTMPNYRTTGTTWLNIRARILRRDPLCITCLALPAAIVSPSAEVDHIVPLHAGGSDNDANLQGICIACHLLKTADEERARRDGSTVYAHLPDSEVVVTRAVVFA